MPEEAQKTSKSIGTRNKDGEVLKELIDRRENLKAKLVGLEKKISAYEHFYLSETHNNFNMVKPVDHIKTIKTSHNVNLGNIKKMKINPDLRIFTSYGANPANFELTDDETLEFFKKYINIEIFKE